MTGEPSVGLAWLTPASRAVVRQVCVTLVLANTAIFLGLALTGRISNAPETIVFVDFWGRFTVYSFWFLAFALFERTIGKIPIVKLAVIILLLLNIPLFLSLAYLGKLPGDPVSAVLIDFWGRLAVYSLWFMAYLTYNRYIADDTSARSETV
jgi:hypothetical protein